LGLGFGFGIGNLIGGAVGTVDHCARKTPVLRPKHWSSLPYRVEYISHPWKSLSWFMLLLHKTA